MELFGCNFIIFQAALREAQEEIGLNPADVKIWGPLPAMITRQATKVQPIVGIIDEEVARKLEPKTMEVQSIFIVSKLKNNSLV